MDWPLKLITTSTDANPVYLWVFLVLFVFMIWIKIYVREYKIVYSSKLQNSPVMGLSGVWLKTVHRVVRCVGMLPTFQSHHSIYKSVKQRHPANHWS